MNIVLKVTHSRGNDLDFYSSRIADLKFNNASVQSTRNLRFS